MIKREYIENDKVYDTILAEVRRNSTGFGKLFKKTFTKEEAASVTGLTFRNMEIKNLDFLRFLPNIEKLDFYDVTGLEYVTGLNYGLKLRWLTFCNTYVPDLGEIAGCRQLTFFAYDCEEGYEHFAKSDFSFLEWLYNLENVSIEGSHLTDVSCFLQCEKLTEIGLVRCPIQTIAPLQQLPHLTHLDLINCGLPELEDIEKFPALEVVTFEDEFVTEEYLEKYRQMCGGILFFC